MAMIEMKTAFALLIRRYDIEILPDQDLDAYYLITVYFKNGLHIKLRPRS